MLGASDRAGDFLAETVKHQPPDVITEGPGTVIGRYKLLQQIGEGGCGVVYMAEQEEPIRRRVAFKVIKLGMDTKQVIARFEAERQALALMDHPNIAKVLDAGATETGRPYFVMELVRGIRITDYCDQNNLSTEQRLDLFIQVCHAIQHAHQKGIIHRDIKPSNILVTMHDGVPVPKVIDFGIAKATRAAADGQDALHGLRTVHRHAGLHEPGAGGDDQPGHRHPQRHLCSGGAALRVADRPDPVRRQRTHGGGPGGDAPDYSGEGAHAALDLHQHAQWRRTRPPSPNGGRLNLRG